MLHSHTSMTIGFDITQAQYRGTGVGEYTYNLAKHLAASGSRHRFVFFGSSLRNTNLLKQLLPKSASVTNRLYPFPNTLLEPLLNSLRLPIELLTGPLNLFHASDWTHPKSSCPNLTTIHDLTPIKFPSHHHPKTISTHHRRLSLATKEAAAIIADSQATKQDIVDLFGYPAEKIHTVHLAAGDEFKSFARSDKQKLISNSKKRLNLPDKYLLSVATAEPRKNLPRAIKAFVNLLSQPSFSDYHLVLVGHIGWGPQLTKHIPQPAADHIHTLGFISKPDLLAVYSAASVFVYPSLYEGFGLPILEAMTLGVPVVTSKRGSLKEVAGSAAVTVDPESLPAITSGIKTALTHHHHFSQLGKKQASLFSWHKTARQTLAVYETLLKR